MHPMEESGNGGPAGRLDKLPRDFQDSFHEKCPWHDGCWKDYRGNQPVLAPLSKDLEIMKTIRYLVLTGIAAAGLCGAGSVWAQTTSTPPVTVAPHAGTGGAPAGIKTLITSFDKTRDKYLAAQDLLLKQLKNATTAAEREQIREQLQDNRQAFLEALKDFREQLKDDLTALKGKISHEEFLRIINAAQEAATEGGFDHHKGH